MMRRQTSFLCSSLARKNEATRQAKVDTVDKVSSDPPLHLSILVLVVRFALSNLLILNYTRRASSPTIFLRVGDDDGQGFSAYIPATPLQSSGSYVSATYETTIRTSPLFLILSVGSRNSVSWKQ